MVHLIRAAFTICFWGRATGKTEGPGADFTSRNAMDMPRSNGIIASTTYEKLLITVLPGLIQGWEKLGYKENKHFWVRKYAPDHLDRPKAYRHPEIPKHYVHWWNGSGQYLVSLDRPSLSNGLNVDYLYGDEARFFKYPILREVLLTIRGNGSYFGDMSSHGSILFTTDLPQEESGNYLYEYEKMMNPEVVEAILMIQKRTMELTAEMETATKRKKRKLERSVQAFEAAMNELRKELVYVSYASTIDNVHALGLKPIQNFKRTLTDYDFQVSVLSRRQKKILSGFYSFFDEEEHGYEAHNYEYIDSIDQESYREVRKNCLWDKDIDLRVPLEISCDYNNSINCVVVGQEGYDGFATRNAMYVLQVDELLLNDLVEKFCDYYEPHQTKEVHFYYDNTSIGGKADTDISYADRWINGLRGRGWIVYDHYIGQQPSHHSRFIFWENAFKGTGGLPKYRQNKHNCHQLSIALNNTGTLQVKGETKKDKRKEQDKTFPQQDAPHLTDANDTLWIGKFRDRLDETTTSPGAAVY